MSDIRDELELGQVAEFYETAKLLSAEMRALIMSIVSAGFETELKCDKSVVTTADIEAEKLFRKRVSEIYPEHGVLGEEFGLEGEGADFRWIVDPVDGTSEFAAGLPLYGSILGLHYKGAPLVGVTDHPALEQTVSAAWKHGAFNNEKRIILNSSPALNETTRVGIAAPENFVHYSDELSIFQKAAKKFPVLRIYHSCFLHTGVYTGGLDVGIEWNLKPWDFAALPIIIEEAGGVYREVKNVEGLEEVPIISAVFGPVAAVNEICQSLEL